MITYINILLFAFMTSIGMSCEKEKEIRSDDFFYGEWNQIGEDQLSIAFFYAEGFDLRKNGTAAPRFDYNNDGNFSTYDDNVGSWKYYAANQTIEFKEAADQTPAVYQVTFISNDEIKLLNTITDTDFYFRRQ